MRFEHQGALLLSQVPTFAFTPKTTIMGSIAGRKIASRVPATSKGPINRLIGTVDIDGAGIVHPLEQVDPFMLLDHATIKENNKPTFGSHPHRGHSVVTLLLNGSVTSWDSVTKKETTVTGPASYWVDAASGLFHDETSVITDESDASQHAVIFQLWMSVKEEDRVKPPSLQYDTNLPLGDVVNELGETVGSIRYFVGGENTCIKTIRPIFVGLVTQAPGTTSKVPIDPTFGGFVVHMEGAATYGDMPDATMQANDVLVLADAENKEETEKHLHVTTSSSGACQYLICAGEKVNESWYKKLAANGAIIAKSPEEARAIAAQIELHKTFAPPCI